MRAKNDIAAWKFRNGAFFHLFFWHLNSAPLRENLRKSNFGKLKSKLSDSGPHSAAWGDLRLSVILVTPCSVTRSPTSCFADSILSPILDGLLFLRNSIQLVVLFSYN
jgi:hypothetical protein